MAWNGYAVRSISGIEAVCVVRSISGIEAEYARST